MEAVKRGLGQPVGSLTQLATIRLGKRTEIELLTSGFRSARQLDDLVFGGWDIFEDNAYEAAVQREGPRTPTCSSKLKEPLSAIKPMKAVFDPEYVTPHPRPERESRAVQDGQSGRC